MVLLDTDILSAMMRIVPVPEVADWMRAPSNRLRDWLIEVKIRSSFLKKRSKKLFSLLSRSKE